MVAPLQKLCLFLKYGYLTYVFMHCKWLFLPPPPDKKKKIMIFFFFFFFFACQLVPPENEAGAGGGGGGACQLNILVPPRKCKDPSALCTGKILAMPLEPFIRDESLLDPLWIRHCFSISDVVPRNRPSTLV